MHQALRFVGVLSLAICMISATWADNGKGHGKGQGVHGQSHKERVRIDAPDRAIIREYMGAEYVSACPPGLAKKHNGCLPPGQAKKRYVIGQPLAVAWEPVPQPLLVRLQPVPVGYQYVMVDKDVLLISGASHHVIDAITLLSAVGD